ncbi:acyl-CoA dehydrogenase family protein [Mycobacterium sp. SMC-8]|uniref:acyl-CoA dehydrogenase family protein n=1 Tax=Mycobacterium sp. SMC-8 TaxID=2857060 RepID=UPI0021B352EF|nr:acyl-CoA dehydrogenase family protein [Mycobacterium sp. SMC-8]UXA15551.1 acyl-CoA dehydrogenase family protein [Mycobacterium sp. SMC-8]
MSMAKSDGVKIDRFALAREWQALLVDNGLAAPGWPKSAGGMDLSVEDQLEYYRMNAAAGAPPHPCPLSFILAPTLIKHGTPEQRDRYLQPLLRADELWCQGFSEPGAGSDLASLSTRAIRDGDTYLVNGQKVWTSMADRADWMFTLVRTGSPGRGAEGISYLLIKMDSPGITVRPLRDISGAVHFAEVFLDDVRVPVENLVGDEGAGWSIMRTSLGHERATAFLADEFKYRRTVDQVLGLVVSQSKDTDPLVRQQVAKLESDVRTIAANSARALAALLRGEDPGGVASVNRLFKSEFEQRLHRLALRVLGSHAALGSRAPSAIDGGRWTFGYLMSRATTIGAGTAEIQRNTIAESVLGLPSHRAEGTRTAPIRPGSPLAMADPGEQEMREVLSSALHSTVDIAAVLDPARPFDTTDRKVWDVLVDFGLPGLAIAESDGGAGAGMKLLCVALEEAGRSLASTPLVPTVTALHLAQLVGAKEVVDRIVSGHTAAFAVPADDTGWLTSGLELPVWDGGRLTGVVPVVPGAPVAQVLLVLARAAVTGEPMLVLVEPGADGLRVDPQQPLDLTSTVATLTASDVVSTCVASGDTLVLGLATAARIGALAVAADAVGVTARALQLAVEWAGDREQFGRPIGSFQAISHKCADMLVGLESARSLVMAAADLPLDDETSQLAVDLAAAAAIDTAVRAAEEALQIHGGIGFTWEHLIHLALRRALSAVAMVGQPDSVRDRAAAHILAPLQEKRLEQSLAR